MSGNNTQQQINDLALENFHSVEMMFYPNAWSSAQNKSCTWYEEVFPPNPRNLIPNAPGVYVFVVTPNIFDFEHSSGLFYIGKATNLYSRIASYISEINKEFKRSSRPHIWRMVNVWNGHLKYYYMKTHDVAEAEALEKEMLKAFRPPFNRQYDAETSQTMRAFL